MRREVCEVLASRVANRQHEQKEKQEEMGLQRRDQGGFSRKHDASKHTVKRHLWH